jgi:transposase
MASTTLPATSSSSHSAEERLITGGVDTHLDVHVAAALDRVGGLLGTASFPTNPAGYRALHDWLTEFGTVVQVGVEGTSSYGAGLTRHLQAAGLRVVEVDRPNRQKRRRVGKSDTLDAISAARAALAGEALGAPKSKDGNVEGIRALGVARLSATKARTQTLNQIRSLVSTAPADLREQLRTLTIGKLVATCAVFRPGDGIDVTTISKVTLRTLSRRVQYLEAEIADLDARRLTLVSQVAPDLLATPGVGPHTAATLLVCVGDNPERLATEATFARLCGVAPIPTGTGLTDGYVRLHRGGDRQANSALWRIVLVRMATDPKTKTYVARRTKEGKQKRFIIRCLKRYVAREIFQQLPRPAAALTT